MPTHEAAARARLNLVPIGARSPENVEAAKSSAGGWTRATLAAWGVPWPPPKGWRERLTQRRVVHAPTAAVRALREGIAVTVQMIEAGYVEVAEGGDIPELTRQIAALELEMDELVGALAIITNCDFTPEAWRDREALKAWATQFSDGDAPTSRGRITLGGER